MRAFTYVAPATLDATLEALSAARPGTKILAGGTTLYDLMKLGELYMRYQESVYDSLFMG